MTSLTRVAIVGWGNVGKGVCQALQKVDDVVMTGILSRDPARVIKETGFDPTVVRDANSLKAIESLAASSNVAILCGGSATDLRVQGPIFAVHSNIVDSFDTHADIPEYERMIDGIARFHKHTAVICGGWDPGTFSLERVLGNAFIPGSKDYTFWGPGVSQGHSQAIRAVPGVLDGIQYTIPIQKALKAVRSGTKPELTTRQKHTRDCYIALKPGADEEAVRRIIITMPKYYADYNTTVTIETPKQIAERKKQMSHGGFVMTSGETRQGNKALIEYRNQWASNPEATGNILVACARACNRLHREGKVLSAAIQDKDTRDQVEAYFFGAKTMLDIPATYYSSFSRAELLKAKM